MRASPSIRPPLSRFHRWPAFGPAIGLAALSGAAALAHELLWTRRLIDLIGGGLESSARVFGCVFLGLALGAAWIAPRLATIARPWRAAAYCEILTGLLSLPALSLPWWSGWLWPRLGPEVLVSPLGSLVKLDCSAAVVLPPALAMGATWPLLVRACRFPLRVESRPMLVLYAANTLGGVAGLLIVVLFGLPILGPTGTMLLSIVANGAAAIGMLALDRIHRASVASSSASIGPAIADDSGTFRDRWGPEGIAFLSGFVILAAEMIGLESLMLAAPVSFYAPAAILATVLLTLGLAALASMRTPPAPGDAAVSLLATLALASVALAATPVLFLGVAPFLGDLVRDPRIEGFLARVGLLTLASFGPAFYLAGQVFPATLAWAGASSRGLPESRLARLLAINGVGGLLGAELAYRGIMPRFGLHLGMVVVATVALVGAILLLGATERAGEARRRSGLQVGAAALIVASLGFGWVRALPHVNPKLGWTVRDQAFGREGTVAVVEGETIGRSLLMSNQYMLGGTAARWDQERQAHLPLAFHGAPRDVAFIGLATGITPGAAVAHPGIERITAVEISPLVVDLARRHFSEFNHRLADDPRVSIVVEDGRVLLASCRERFDVLVGDLYLPWGPGESRLFTADHYRSARRSLRPGGLFCQWLPLYQLTPDQLDRLMASFRSVFPDARLLRGGFDPDRPVLGLLGFRDGSADWGVVSRRCREIREAGVSRDPSVRHPEAIAMLDAGKIPGDVASAPILTLAGMGLELDAGRERLTGKPGMKYLQGDRFVRWFRDRLLDRQGPKDDDDNSTDRLRDLGFRVTLNLGARAVRARAGRPYSDPPSDMPELPRAILDDDGADWSRWAIPRGPAATGGVNR